MILLIVYGIFTAIMAWYLTDPRYVMHDLFERHNRHELKYLWEEAHGIESQCKTVDDSLSITGGMFCFLFLVMGIICFDDAINALAGYIGLEPALVAILMLIAFPALSWGISIIARLPIRVWVVLVGLQQNPDLDVASAKVVVQKDVMYFHLLTFATFGNPLLMVLVVFGIVIRSRIRIIMTRSANGTATSRGTITERTIDLLSHRYKK